jgi:hypothetical protein
LTKAQVDFLEDWHAAGGRAGLLLQVGGEYLLLDPSAARAIFDKRLTRDDLMDNRAAVYSAAGFPARALVRALTE